jgi:DNA-binding NtrC family response regulator
VLDTRKFRRLGGEMEISVDVRIAAATNRDLAETVRQGEFREDLYYRLNVVEIRIPPLRERAEDIDRLAAYYFDTFRRKFAKPDLQLTADAWQLLRKYPWPGNVRELINVLERAVLLTTDNIIESADLPIESPAPERAIKIAVDNNATVHMKLPEEGVGLAVVERALIEKTLELTRGNVSRTAQMLGLSRGALRNKLARYNINAKKFHGPALIR